MGGAVGVLVMAYGSPRVPEEIEAYYTDIRRGRAPSPEQLADLRRRYEAIGGLSPLNARSNEQLAALRDALEAITPGRYRLAYGTKHARPTIAQAVAELGEAGCQCLLGLVLAPQYSAFSVGEYEAEARAAAGARDVPISFLSSWARDEALVSALARRVGDGLARLADTPKLVIFSAHSLPARLLEVGDPYPAEVGATAAAVAQAAGLSTYELAYQSAPKTPEPWLGPSLSEQLERASATGVASVLVCPVGFTSDHLEILYDLDIEAAARARDLGLSFARTASINAEPAVFSSLARQLARLGPPAP